MNRAKAILLTLAITIPISTQANGWYKAIITVGVAIGFFQLIKNPLLFCATAFRFNKIMKRLIVLGANPNKKIWGIAPLEVAFERPFSYETMELLLQAGANPNVVDEEGNTLLHYYYGGYAGKLKKSELLLKYGANPHLKNKKGQTALEVEWDYLEIESLNNHRICAGPTLDFSRLLLNYNVDTDLNKYPLLWRALRRQEERFVEELLVHYKADPDVVWRNDWYFENQTLLHVTTRIYPHAGLAEKYYSIAKVLLESGANLYAKDIRGNTPLYYAIEQNNLKNAALILLHAGDYEKLGNQKNNDGKTPFDVASKEGRVLLLNPYQNKEFLGIRNKYVKSPISGIHNREMGISKQVSKSIF